LLRDLRRRLRPAVGNLAERRDRMDRRFGSSDVWSLEIAVEAPALI
jgi:hypothetical protein